jgi:predicted ArsR family transcriptional regulator
MTVAQQDAIQDVATLAEPVRRALYDHVAAARQPVGRDAAAAAVGISRALAAFHLDRLVDAGLLAVTYRRLSGRTGPGAGRPAKLYHRSDREVHVSLPARRYELAASLFAEALSGESPGSPLDAVQSAARRFGESLGEEARRRAGRRRGRRALQEAAQAVLDETGFEPIATPDGGIALRNCPFDALARANRDLVCGMNLSLMDGVIGGLRATGVTAELDPQPGMCCVVWRRAADGVDTGIAST